MTRHINPSHVWDTVHGEVELRSDHLYDLMGLQVSPSYIIYKDGDLVKAKNGGTGVVEFSGVDAAEVIQQAINALKNGGKIFIKAGTYEITETITIPQDKNITIEGELCGLLFPTLKLGDDANCDMFYREATTSWGFLHIVNLQLHGNKENNTSGTGIKLTGARGAWDVVIKRLYIRDFAEYGIYASGCHGVHIMGGTVVEYCGLDGVFLGNGDESLMMNCYFAGNGHSGIYLQNLDGIVVVGNHSWNNGRLGLFVYLVKNGVVVANTFKTNGGVSYYPADVAFRSSDVIFVANHIKSDSDKVSYSLYIMDEVNTVCIGNKFSGVTPAINIVPSICKLNSGYVTENGGVATFSGDGSTTQFAISHGLVAEPEIVNVTPLSADAAGDFYVTKDSTYIYVNYLTAPPSGTDNVVLSWRAEV